MAALLTWVAIAMAAPSTPTDVPHPHARTGRNIGIVVAAPGIFIGGLGTALLVSGATSRPCADDPGAPPDCGMGQALSIGFGALGVAASVPFLAVGVPLWVRGNHRIRKNKLVIGAMPRQEGATLQLAVHF